MNRKLVEVHSKKGSLFRKATTKDKNVRANFLSQSGGREWEP